MATTERASLEDVRAWLEGMAGWTFDFGRALGRCLIAIVSATKENFRGGHAPDGTAWAALKFGRPGQKSGGKPLRDKGLLAASLAARGELGNVHRETPTSLEWGTNLEKAALHQYGGTITPKNAKALSIPLTREAARAGSPRNFGRPLVYEWARGRKLVGKLVEVKAKLSKTKTPRKSITHYLLVSEVTVPARPFLGWNESLAEECAAIVADAAASAIVQARISGDPKLAA